MKIITAFITFLKEEKEEIKRVTWPNRKTLARLTGVVLIITVFVALYSAVWDFLFQTLMGFALSK